MNISWEQLEKNTESKEIGFESFNFQIASAVYKSYGRFEYDYNTPGSEFYLKITIACPELCAEPGDTVGWQAKFWINRSDPDNTSFDRPHREELIEGFKKTLEYKNNLKTWIICTPGRPANTAPHYVRNALESELRKIKPDIEVTYWNKAIYEAFYHEYTELLAPIYKHYFSARFIGFRDIEQYSQRRIKRLNRKYDADIYTPGKADKEVKELIDILSLGKEMHARISTLKEGLRKIDQNVLACEYVTVEKAYIDDEREIYDVLNRIGEYISDVESATDPFLIVDHILNCPKPMIKRVNELLRKNRNGRHISSANVPEEIVQHERRYLSELRDHINDLLNNINIVFKLEEKISRKSVHIFGTAGTGKTNLAANILCKG
ncbi:MAG: hypothetical protein ABSG75_12350 [Syntrophales bacterium]|jgi:uncharacterized protein YnzC (UPF0291/DUF896 family)